MERSTTDARLPAPLKSDARIVGTSQTVGDFWAWAYSDILDSVTRGTLAEFIVRTALSISGTVRDNGSAFDLEYEGHGLQVKSSSAVQRWQRAASPRMSFSIKATRPYVLEDGELAALSTRSGDCWIFCAFRPPDRGLDSARAGLLDVKNWFFWAVPTSWLPTGRGSLPLGELRGEFASKVDFRGLRDAVELAIQRNVDRVAAPVVRPMDAQEWVTTEELHLVPTDRLGRIVELVVTTTQALHPTHPTWMPHFQPGYAGIRTSIGRIRLQVQADLLAASGHDLRIGLRVPPKREVPAEWLGRSDGGRDIWWPVSSSDLPSAEFVAGVLRNLYPG